MFINPAFVHIAGIHYPHMLIGQHPSLTPAAVSSGNFETKVIPVDVAALHHYRYLSPSERNINECTVTDTVFFDASYLEKKNCKG
jgi:hypothetical protein